MYKNKTFLAIIPARGGSKRLPRKNILDLCGKPLVRWSIEAGLESKYIDKVIVTSDDKEILNIASDTGAEVIDRPLELSGDKSTTFDAIEHTIDSVEKYDYIVLLQPTSPLRNSQHVNEAVELLMKKEADSVVSVCEVDHSPLWTNTLPKDGNMKDFLSPNVEGKRSQDLELNYRLNGAIYIIKRERLIQESSFFLKDKAFAYKMDRRSSVDIDEDDDFLVAECYAKEILYR